MLPNDLVSFALEVRSETYNYRTPMKFGGRVVNDVTILSVDCDGRSKIGGRGRGLGSMTMGVVWAWPNTNGDGPNLTDTEKLEIVIELCQRLVTAFNDSKLSGHPLDICHHMASVRQTVAKQLAEDRKLSEPIPDLAILLAASPIEGALFDAHGKAAGVSSYALLSRADMIHDLAHYLGESAYRGLFLGDLISPTPVDSMPLYHLVGALDPLTNADVQTPAGDGLPETLSEWIKRDGLTHLKIKLNGDDATWDTDRIVHTYRVANEARNGEWAFSLDFNERCPDEDYVMEVLDGITRKERDSLRAIRYVEQPTKRDLLKEPIITMHRVRERLPVVIDESLVNLASLRTAIGQGYSGIALKACKGHAEALLLGAVARNENLFLCVQDLTCVGASLLHSASLAAHIPGVTAIESNGRQYAPKGNERWLDKFAPFFEVRGGAVPTRMLAQPGLGYGNDPIFQD
ncbi:mandelate racemase/muconate lactonizing enzyme family protein [Planctomycetes bacterium CA13]